MKTKEEYVKCMIDKGWGMQRKNGKRDEDSKNELNEGKR